MNEPIYVDGWNRCKIATAKTPYDTSSFVNDGPFFELHPGTIPTVRRYERQDEQGRVVESWERDKNGRMVETTARDKAIEELIAAQENLEKLRKAGKNDG